MKRNRKMDAQHCWKMVLDKLESIAHMLLEKGKLIKKLINLSFFSLKCFQHSTSSHTLKQCLSAALAATPTHKLLCRSGIIAFCLEIWGQEVRRRFFGAWTVLVMKWVVGDDTSRWTSVKHMILSDKSTLVLRGKFVFWYISETQDQFCWGLSALLAARGTVKTSLGHRRGDRQTHKTGISQTYKALQRWRATKTAN